MEGYDRTIASLQQQIRTKQEIIEKARVVGSTQAGDLR